MVTKIALPTDLSEGFSMPANSMHQVCIGIKGNITKANFHLGDHRWASTRYDQGTVRVAAAGQNGLGWQWHKDDVIEQIHKVVMLVSPDKLRECAAEYLDVSQSSIEIPLQAAIRDEMVVRLAHGLLLEMSSSGDICHLYQEMAMNMLCMHLLKRYSTITNVEKEFRSGLEAHKLRKVVEYIHSYYNTRITIESMAKLCSMSVFHFARLFKQSTGFSPRQYVINVRIRQARCLLDSTSLLIEDVALLVGYEDVNGFSRSFRQNAGCSPYEYRQNL